MTEFLVVKYSNRVNKQLGLKSFKHNTTAITQMLNCNITVLRGGSRAAATSKMERFVIIVNGFQPLTIITKHSILDVAAVLDPPLVLSRSMDTSAEVTLLHSHTFSVLNIGGKLFLVKGTVNNTPFI